MTVCLAPQVGPCPSVSTFNVDLSSVPVSCSGRLEDKAAIVRKCALQLLSKLMCFNPFGKFLPLDQLTASLDKYKLELQVPCPQACREQMPVQCLCLGRRANKPRLMLCSDEREAHCLCKQPGEPCCSSTTGHSMFCTAAGPAGSPVQPRLQQKRHKL